VVNKKIVAEVEKNGVEEKVAELGAPSSVLLVLPS